MCKEVCQHCQKTFKAAFPFCPPQESALLLLDLVTRGAVEGVWLSKVYTGLYSGGERSKGGPKCLCAPCSQSLEEGSYVLPKPPTYGEEFLVRSQC